MIRSARLKRRTQTHGILKYWVYVPPAANDFVLSFVDRPAADERDLVPQGGKALEEAIDHHLRATCRWMCQVPPI